MGSQHSQLKGEVDMVVLEKECERVVVYFLLDSWYYPGCPYKAYLYYSNDDTRDKYLDKIRQGCILQFQYNPKERLMHGNIELHQPQTRARPDCDARLICK